jgi:hypothetical protein
MKLSLPLSVLQPYGWDLGFWSWDFPLGFQCRQGEEERQQLPTGGHAAAIRLVVSDI